MKLEPGEVICPMCDGEKYHPEEFTFCPKCNGDGKLDWVENIVGKRSRFNRINVTWPTDNAGYYSAKMIDEMSKKISDKIDKDIVKHILGEWSDESKSR